MAAEEEKNRNLVEGKKKRNGSIRSIFIHADLVDRFLMILGLIGCLGDGFILPLVFLVGSKMMNNIGSARTMTPEVFSHKINQNAVLMLYVACVAFVSGFLEGYCWSRTAERQASRMRARYLKAVLRQDVEYFDIHVTSTSEIVRSVSNDSLIIQDVLSEKIPNLLMNATTFFGCYLVAFLVFWRLAIVGVPFVLFLVVPGIFYGRTLMGIAKKIGVEYKKAGTIAEQAISSIRTVYAFVGENKTIDEFSTTLNGSMRLRLKQGLAKGLVIGSNSIIFAIMAIMTYYGSRMVMYRGAQGGTIFAVASCMTWGGISLGACLANLKNISEACSAGERIMEVLKKVPKIDSENMEGEILENVSGKVEFRNVDFAYPARPESTILNNFCLKIPAGKTQALVGSSGSGKSTTVALLQRFYNPLGGSILLDGVPIDKVQLKWLRSQMSIVSQEPTLFATTIKENILFGKEDASMEEIVEAAKAANAHNFIFQLPQGYDTQVGERGVQMSGGQKQRIAIARALIKGPKVLLLDEATSALDSESERVVQEAMDKAALGRTTIIIAHRLSTIRNADAISVLHNGQVVETGSHDELMENKDGLYASLVRTQQTEKGKTSEAENPISLSSRHSPSVVPEAENTAFRLSAVKSTIEDEKLPIPSFRRLLALNYPERKQAVLGCIGAILTGAVQPTYSFTLGSLVSVLFSTSHAEIKEKTMIYCLCFVGLFIFSLVVNTVQHYNFAYMGEHLTKRVRERMLSKILTFEVGWFDRDENSTGPVCSRLEKDANMVRSLVGDRIGLLVQTISTLIIACTMGLVLAWRLALVITAVQPIIILCFYSRRVLLKNLSKKAIKAQDESSKIAAEAVSNLRTITSFSSQERILKMLEKAQEGPRRESIKQSWFAGIVLGISQALASSSQGLYFWYGGILVSHHQINSKEMFQTFMVLISTGRVIAEAGSMTSDLAKGSDAVSSVFAVLDRNSTIEPDDDDGFKPVKLTGHIEVRDVDFAYPARPNVVIFQGFSINIEAGKSTALVGHSGSGKSTIIGLIERFYDPIRGIVEIDGRDVRSYHLRSLRKHIALVSQEPALFSGTIRDNIAYGASDETNEVEIIEAAKAANAHGFISGLKDGYDTMCGDRGVQLSGGQKQRIAIARAIMKNPAILLLDEATSALDSQSEKVVQIAIERVMVGRTSVVVAHRLSTIQNCDLIVVMDKGMVVEKGTHHSLLAANGAYCSFVSLQQGNQF